jgi:tyrosyl-tRNA synthetase
MLYYQKDKIMAKYCVYCTQIWNGVAEVEANSKNEAINKVQESLGENVDSIHWDFGEATADYVEEVKENRR